MVDETQRREQSMWYCRACRRWCGWKLDGCPSCGNGKPRFPLYADDIGFEDSRKVRYRHIIKGTLRSAVRTLLSREDSCDGEGRTEDSSGLSEQRRRGISRETLKKMVDYSLFHCLLCDQVFPTYDVFYEHRYASEADIAWQGDDEFDYFEEIEIGDSLPPVELGPPEPCQPIVVQLRDSTGCQIGPDDIMVRRGELGGDGDGE